MKQLMRYVLAVMGLMLFGCTTPQLPSDVALPLAVNQPTFLFFYTDN